jgi:hypothetical protein
MLLARGAAKDSNQPDIEYWLARAEFERAAAKASADPRVRHVHAVMALRYQTWIDRASARKSPAA